MPTCVPPGQRDTLGLHEAGAPVRASLAAIEAVLGLVIEITFIAPFTQR